MLKIAILLAVLQLAHPIFPLHPSLIIPMGLVATIGTLELYSRLPIKSVHGNPSIGLLINGESIVILFHGAGGQDSNSNRICLSIENDGRKSRRKEFVINYDWTKWRGNMIRAAYDAENVGEILGVELARMYSNGNMKLQSIHAVGVSVGAFAANSFVQAYKEEHKKLKASSDDECAFCRLTLLDPFTARGLFDFSYGARNFGKLADFCEQYLNSDDPVPSTNRPLPLAHCFDITDSTARKSFTPLPGDSMHSWPGM